MDMKSIRLYMTLLLVVMIISGIFGITGLTSKDYSLAFSIAFHVPLVIALLAYFMRSINTMSGRLATTIGMMICYPLGNYIYHCFLSFQEPDPLLIVAHYKTLAQIATALLFFGLYELSAQIDVIQSKTTSSDS